jgi:hypothetical protein
MSTLSRTSPISPGVLLVNVRNTVVGADTVTKALLTTPLESSPLARLNV